ncbi:hypothetical protein GCM10022234_20360 [Aeromicrobium panaciterrae]|uniref:DUF3180 domain-containing protein n=1 Tax=Aeromicrobium panaciterrae TaxID=363861 RepID=UPI0031DE7F8D
MNKSRRTSALLLAALIGTGLVLGRIVPELLLRADRSVPVVGWGAALALFLGALVLGFLAWSTWQSLHKKNQRMTSDHGVTMLALAKASAVVAALFAGVYGGYAVSYLDSFDSPLGKDRVIHAGAAAIAGLLMMAAALVLERALRIPGDDDESEGGKTAPTPA